MQGEPASVTEEAKPSTQAPPLLYDLTSLQREANSRFGFSARTTLSIAQALYEKHKVLTYPRTDSRALPEDYVAVAKDTIAMISKEDMPGPLRALAVHARTALKEGYVKPIKRIFDNAKVSDHFAIIPTLLPPKSLSEVEAKLYDMVAKRFLAVFFPSAEFMVTTRISTVATAGKEYRFQTNGKVMVKPGWLAVYGREAQEDDANLVAVAAGELARTESIDVKALKTRPPARYTEATLLSAMEGAGKLIDDDELREAMQEKGLGTPATRAAIIEGLIYEKYIHREGRELVPGAKAFQLMTLLRGLGVEDLTKPELTGNWEYQLAEMEKGHLERETFMQQIAEMAERIVRKAKEYDRDTIPGDYATLATPCPNCGGVIKENYRRYACTGIPGKTEPCGFSISKIPGGRAFELPEVEAFLRDKRIGPLEGFRSKAGWPFTAEIKLVRDDELNNWKLEFDFGEDAQARRRIGRAGRFLGAGKPGGLPEDAGQGLRVRHQLRLRALGRRPRHLRLQERQGDPAAADRARADDQAAGHRRHRPARRLRLQQDPAQVQGAPGLGRQGGQGRVRVRAAAGAAAGEAARRRRGGGEAGAGEEGRRRGALRRRPRRRRRRRQGPAPRRSQRKKTTAKKTAAKKSALSGESGETPSDRRGERNEQPVVASPREGGRHRRPGRPEPAGRCGRPRRQEAGEAGAADRRAADGRDSGRRRRRHADHQQFDAARHAGAAVAAVRRPGGAEPALVGGGARGRPAGLSAPSNAYAKPIGPVTTTVQKKPPATATATTATPTATTTATATKPASAPMR